MAEQNRAPQYNNGAALNLKAPLPAAPPRNGHPHSGTGYNGAMHTTEKQAADAVLLVRPRAFHSNPETAASNAFQRDPGRVDPATEQAAASLEFDGLVEALEAAGVETVVVPDTATPMAPDAVYPNNWVSFHADGTSVLYPMMAENRRRERRSDILEHLSRERGFHIERVVDLSMHEQDGRFLEGTGSLVLDRTNRVAYACLSPRTDVELLAEAAQVLGYEPVVFAATDRRGVPVYHTNVLMCVGSDFAVLCADAIRDAAQRRAVVRRLEDTGHEVITITLDQMNDFAGNMLELAASNGARLLALSAHALASLTVEQRAALEARCRLVAAPIPAIEAGGGSVRCMLAEIHLPRRGGGVNGTTPAADTQ
jgi:hypothetical protein